MHRAILLAAALTAAPPAAVAQRAAPPARPPASRAGDIADRTATVGDQRVRYLAAGAGDTLVVLVHGWPASADSWRDVIPRLAGRYRVVAPDLRGVGGSASPSRDYSKAALARDLHAFVRTLGARRVVVVGHDVGGMVAYAYARQFPADVAGVAILDVPVPGFAPWDAIAASPHAWHYDFHAQRPLAEQLVAGRQATYFRYFVDRTAGNARAIDDAEIARFARAYESPTQLAAGFGFYRTFDQDAAFNAAHRGPLRVPLLLVGGDRGMAATTAVTAAAMRAHGATDVRTATVTRSGHWVAEEQPSQVAGLIDRFAAGRR